MDKVQPGIDFTKCICGGTHTIANDILQAEIGKGKMPKGAKAFLFQYQSLIANPTGKWLSAPIVLSFYDVCSDCGTPRCIHIEVRTATPGGKNMPRAGQQFSTG